MHDSCVVHAVPDKLTILHLGYVIIFILFVITVCVSTTLLRWPELFYDFCWLLSIAPEDIGSRHKKQQVHPVLYIGHEGPCFLAATRWSTKVGKFLLVRLLLEVQHRSHSSWLIHLLHSHAASSFQADLGPLFALTKLLQTILLEYSLHILTARKCARITNFLLWNRNIFSRSLGNPAHWTAKVCRLKICLHVSCVADQNNWR